MDSKKVVDYLKSCNKQRVIIIVGAIGVALILMSELVPSTAPAKSEQATFDYKSYVSELEDKTQNIVSNIDGVGKCQVMLTLSQSNESVYAKNIDEKSAQGSYSQNAEYVFYENDGDDTPVLLKQTMPSVQGVLIVCEGGDDVVVREAVVSSVMALFDIPSSKINVTKISINR